MMGQVIGSCRAPSCGRGRRERPEGLIARADVDVSTTADDYRAESSDTSCPKSPPPASTGESRSSEAIVAGDDGSGVTYLQTEP